MKIINAIGDQSLMQLKQGEWYIHTVFEHTFNLTDRKRLPLILITSFDDKRLPGGLYLPQKDFDKLLDQIPYFKKITLDENALNIKTEYDYWHIIVNDQYQLRLNSAQLSADRIKTLLMACQKINRNTGFNKPFKSFLSADTTPFKSEINWLMNNGTLFRAVEFFIGRGRGLTPSGDDFIIGWLLIDQLNHPSVTLKKAIESKISVSGYTTDISRSYLSWGLRGHFSSALLDIINYLHGDGLKEDIERLLKNAVDYGNTSGTDTLSGLVTALIFRTL